MFFLIWINNVLALRSICHCFLNHVRFSFAALVSFWSSHNKLHGVTYTYPLSQPVPLSYLTIQTYMNLHSCGMTHDHLQEFEALLQIAWYFFSGSVWYTPYYTKRVWSTLKLLLIWFQGTEQTQAHWLWVISWITTILTQLVSHKQLWMPSTELADKMKYSSP